MTDPILAAQIHLVDDDPANLLLIERYLGRAAFQDVRSFSDPHAALAAIEADEPDLVILDLHMPGFDGFAFLDALREQIAAEDFLPVLVQTVDVAREIRSRALRSGATDFLAKPFDLEELVLRVRNLIRTRQLHQVVRARNLTLTDEVATSSRSLHDLTTEWAAVAASLGRMTAGDSPEETAASICAEVATLPDNAGVAVLAFGAGVTTIPIGIAPPIPKGFAVNVPLPEERSRALQELAVGGAWIEPWSGATGRARRGGPRAAARLTTVVYVPLREGPLLLGLLVAAVTGLDGTSRLAQRLSSFEAFAALASALLAPGIRQRQHREGLRSSIGRSIAEHAFHPVFQEIVNLASSEVVGYEALTRFADGTRPDRRFADAAAIGLGLELEAATIAAALAAARELPAGTFLGLNVSPDLILDGDRLADLLREAPAPVVLEITEHVTITDYAALRGAIDLLGPSVRSSVDDAGAGFSSLRHIVELKPDFVKLDIGLIRAIDRDPARQALIAGMVYFALRSSCTLVAEGIETDGEFAELRKLSVDLGQGYLIGRPRPISASR